MQGKLRMVLALAVVFGLMMTVSCAKKVVKSDPGPQAGADAGLVTPYKQGDGQVLEQGKVGDGQSDISSRELAAAKDAFVNEHIYFAFDSSALSPEAQAILRQKAEWLRKNPGVSVSIEGHCDERGTTEYNLALGDRRAWAVKSFLTNLGIPGNRLTTISFGDERPADPGHDEYAWAKNRRAQFVLR
jgi:peptidoglycan-associated lipoprotein